MHALPRRRILGALAAVASSPCRGRGFLSLGPRLLMCKSADPSKALASAWMFRAALLFPVRLRREMPYAARAQPQQTDAVSEHPPSKQVGRFILTAFLFAVLSAALAARPPSNVGPVSDKAALVGQAWTVRLPSTLEGGTHWAWTLKCPICFEGGGSRFVLRMLAQSQGLFDINSFFHHQWTPSWKKLA